MAVCSNCDAPLADNAAFCAKCGARRAVSSPASNAIAASAATGPGPSVASPANATARSQMDEKVAALLAYLLGWVTGIVLFLIDKRSYVRFHAAQSIVVFGGLQILLVVLGVLSGLSFLAHGPSGFSLGWALRRLIDLLALVLWIVLMLKAYQGEKFRVPIAADIAERIFGVA